jgi:hypothetical protein
LVDLQPLLLDRGGPASRPYRRLEMTFQQMHGQHHEPALQFAPIAAPYALYLLGYIGGIDSRQCTGT